MALHKCGLKILSILELLMRLQIKLFEIIRSPQSKYSNHTMLSKDNFFL